jgi:hypothetical protein
MVASKKLFGHVSPTDVHAPSNEACWRHFVRVGLDHGSTAGSTVLRVSKFYCRFQIIIGLRDWVASVQVVCAPEDRFTECRKTFFFVGSHMKVNLVFSV